jgi:hypothetical protein
MHHEIASFYLPGCRAYTAKTADSQFRQIPAGAWPHLAVYKCQMPYVAELPLRRVQEDTEHDISTGTEMCLYNKRPKPT